MLGSSVLYILSSLSHPLSPSLTLMSQHDLNPSWLGRRLFVIPHLSFDPAALRGSGHRRHPLVINNRRRLSGDSYSFVLPPPPHPHNHPAVSARVPTIIVFWPSSPQTSEEIHLTSEGTRRDRVAVVCSCQWGEKGLFCCFACPPWTSADVSSY